MVQQSNDLFPIHPWASQGTMGARGALFSLIVQDFKTHPPTGVFPSYSSFELESLQAVQLLSLQRDLE